MSWNTIIFGGMFILSIFIFINLSKVKASKKQLDRPDRINRVYKKPVAAGRASNNFKYSIKPGAPEESIMPFRMQSRDPGIMMPESGRFLNHDEGVALINKWIKSM